MKKKFKYFDGSYSGNANYVKVDVTQPQQKTEKGYKYYQNYTELAPVGRFKGTYLNEVVGGMFMPQNDPTQNWREMSFEEARHVFGELYE